MRLIQFFRFLEEGTSKVCKTNLVNYLRQQSWYEFILQLQKSQPAVRIITRALELVRRLLFTREKRNRIIWTINLKKEDLHFIFKWHSRRQENCGYSLSVLSNKERNETAAVLGESLGHRCKIAIVLKATCNNQIKSFQNSTKIWFSQMRGWLVHT